MVSLINFFIAAAVLTTFVSSETYNIGSVINGTQDYFKIAQAELLHKIKIAELENDAVDARFLDRLAVIELQQQQVLNETQQVNQTIIPLQALNLVRKYCIQKYDSQFVTHQSAKDQCKKCMNVAQNAGSDLTSTANSFTKTAKNYAIYVLPRYLQSCTSSYKTNQTKHEKCFIDEVQTAVEYVQSNLDKAQFNREQSVFKMNTISLSAVQCSYKVEKVVLDTIALTSKKINDCVDEVGKQYGYGNKKALK